MNPKQFYETALERAGRALVESEQTFQFLLTALLVGGNVLLEGVPGTAKTLMARTLAQLLACSDPENNTSADEESHRAQRFQRIQFTPDLMPSDILGTNVFNVATSTFTLRPGPIFANVVVADEVNRAPAKTQSALLEAMEEHQVTIEGRRLTLPEVFLVVATQNPVEFEGTYPLPEAQLDRFLFKLLVGYASASAERDIVLRHHRGFRLSDLVAAGVEPLADQAGILDLRRQIAGVALDESVAGYIVEIERGTRSVPEVQYGSSVRGAIGLMSGAKAIAAFAGRDYVTPDDVKTVAPPVLRHRIVLKPEAELDGIRPDDVIARLLANVAVPR